MSFFPKSTVFSLSGAPKNDTICRSEHARLRSRERMHATHALRCDRTHIARPLVPEQTPELGLGAALRVACDTTSV
jgi:hypothetical protein